jgi:hypothetical protein
MVWRQEQGSQWRTRWRELILSAGVWDVGLSLRMGILFHFEAVGCID